LVGGSFDKTETTISLPVAMLTILNTKFLSKSQRRSSSNGKDKGQSIKRGLEAKEGEEDKKG
jgi:hypothetical protein